MGRISKKIDTLIIWEDVILGEAKNPYLPARWELPSLKLQ